MKTYIVALLFTAVIVSSLCAQESKPAASATPVPTATMDPLSPEPLQLIPDAPSTVPKPSGRSTGQQSAQQPTDSQPSIADAKEKLKKSKAASDADELKERIRFREVKTQALKEAKVQQKWELSQAARTIPGRTEALKQYYSLLYARMLAIDPSLKPRIGRSKEEALTRLEKTEAINLSPAVHANW